MNARLRTSEAEIATFIVVDLGVRAPLLIHERTAALLGISGQGPVDVLAAQSEVTLANLDAVAQALEPLEDLTREHAEALGDVPAVAVLGLPAFRGRKIELDVYGRELRVMPPEVTTPGAQDSTPTAATRLTYTARAYGYWLESETVGGEKLRVRFTTSEYDTRIGINSATRLGFPGGNLPRLMLGNVDLMQYTVLRPSDVSAFPEPQPDIILGTGLLSHFLVTLLPDQEEISLLPLREGSPALEERALFVARAQSDAEEVEAFLRDHADSRLADEASEALLAFRLDAVPPEPDAIQRAMTYRATTARRDRRAMRMVRLADEMIALEDDREDAYDLARMALDIGQEYAGDDLDDTAIHHINARRGLIALLRDDTSQARRYLLSAAFGLPKDPYVNLWLGRLYEVTDQPIRAWSRYVEAALRDDPPVGALRGLDRLNQSGEFRRDFSMEDAGRLLEGRIPVFMPIRPYEQVSGGTAAPVHLVELFTNVNNPSTQAAQMAFDGLRAYLEVADTVFVQYHLDDLLATDAAEGRAAYYEVQRTPMAIFDGAARVDLGGDDTAAARVFTQYVDHAVRQEPPAERQMGPSPVLQGQARWREGSVDVRLTLTDVKPEDNHALHLLLCERTVMAIGVNGQALHHAVVRSRLSPEQGWLVEGRRGTFATETNIAEIRDRLNGRLDRLEQGNDDRLPMRSAWIDPDYCDVIAILQDLATRHVVSATVLTREETSTPN